MPVSHVGILPRPSALDEVLAVEGASQAEFERVLSDAVGQTIEHWLSNDHYPDNESFLMAIAETMRVSAKPLPTPG
jgi:methionine synthase II (cobalamin-independent)